MSGLNKAGEEVEVIPPRTFTPKIRERTTITYKRGFCLGTTLAHS